MTDDGAVPRSTASAIRIRDATPSDLPVVLELLAEAALPTDGVPEALGAFVVAESAADGSRLLGAVGLEFHGGHALLRSLVVAEAARGTGVGAALTEAALAAARHRDCADVWLLTTTAESWFPRWGFVAVARSAVPPPLLDSVEFRGACPTSAVVMTRPPGTDHGIAADHCGA